MQTFASSQQTFFDVDDTLIIWNPTPEQLQKDGIDFYNDETYEMERFVPHKKHVSQLMKHKQRGHTIVVWSAGGYKWAEKAVKILGLQNYVDMVMSKPLWWYDDKNAEECFGRPSYYKDE